MLLDWHIELGKGLRRWKIDSFAVAIGVKSRTLFDYRKDQDIPSEERQFIIEKTVFGEGAERPGHPKHLEWAELHCAFDKARSVDADDQGSELSPTSPPQSQTVGPNLYLLLDPDGRYAKDNYVHCDIHSSHNRAQYPLLVWFDAAFLPVEAGLPRLRTVQIEIEPLDRLIPEEIFAHGKPNKLEFDVEIRWLGRRNYTNCWEISLPGRGQTLHHLNVNVYEPPLFVLYGAKPGTVLKLRIFADSVKDFIVKAGVADDGQRTRKQAIMDRLGLKEIGEPSDSGRILLIETENVVAEAK
jgi:hypothetical protein